MSGNELASALAFIWGGQTSLERRRMAERLQSAMGADGAVSPHPEDATLDRLSPRQREDIGLPPLAGRRGATRPVAEPPIHAR